MWGVVQCLVLTSTTWVRRVVCGMQHPVVTAAQKDLKASLEIAGESQAGPKMVHAGWNHR